MGRGRVPFYRHVTTVEAGSRQEAIDRIASAFPPPHYGKYRASRSAGKPSAFFS